MAKIVRTHFLCHNVAFFFDRSYDEKRSDQQNCDDALNFVANLVEQKKAMAVMQVVPMRTHNKETGEDGTANLNQPALINFANVLFITITNVAVYELDKQEQKPNE